MRPLFATIRILFAILGAAAVIATFAATAAHARINPFNFFGYFTIQSNIAFVCVLFITAIAGFLGHRDHVVLSIARGCVATYMIIVGIVYNTLLTNVDVSIPVPWANTVLHSVLPVYALLDWLLFGDRPPLPWRRLWVVLIYPIVWLAVVLIRVATDGFAFYPFLDFNDPKYGPGGVALYCVIIAVAMVVFGLLIWAISRLRILRPKAVPAA
jgi:hypothetical protein